MVPSLSNRCVGCGCKLRDALFCRGCGQAACSWECLTRHRAQHARTARAGPGPSPAAGTAGGRFGTARPSSAL
jgi:hypothetical protein